MTTILLIDDHGLLRSGLTVLIETLFNHVEVTEVDGISQFEEMHTSLRPDLIIAGVNSALWKMTVSTLHIIKKYTPQSRLIIYDEFRDAASITALLGMGIQGYLLKKSNVDELVTCIKTVLRSKSYISQDLFNLMAPVLIEKKNEIKKITKLTAWESEVASFLMQGLGTGKIAEKLGRKPATISNIKKTIYKKMNVKNILELRDACHQVG